MKRQVKDADYSLADFILPKKLNLDEKNIKELPSALEAILDMI